MTNKEKRKRIKELRNNNIPTEGPYYELLKDIGGLKTDYDTYIETSPINCNEELKRLPSADFDLCCALLTMLLREDHFSNGSFAMRYQNGDVELILDRMISLLEVNYMDENQWTSSIKKLLTKAKLGKNICCDTLVKVPYAQEILSYNLDFTEKKESTIAFETDLLIYEKTDIIKPRVIVEAKIDTVTTHDAITYSYKAQSHKNVTPYLRYGIMLGNRKHYPLPGRLFRHGTNFDFMISFREYELNENEISAFVKLIKREISYSKKLEEMIYTSRSQERKKYFMLQNELRLEEM